MKTTSILILLITTSFGQTLAQRPDFSAACKKEMQQLSYLVGDWKGEAMILTQNGPIKVQQKEHIEWKLDGLVLSIEGIGKEQEKVSFHAFALINYDATQQQFKMRSYVKEGMATDAYFKVVEPNKFEWGFDIATGGKTRYTITLNPEKKTWAEKGEFSRDGSQWMKIIELNLTKE